MKILKIIVLKKVKFNIQKEDNFNDIITKINEYGEIININMNSDIFQFKFKKGSNYTVSENGLILTKVSGGAYIWNCTIFGDKEIPKNKISKWKIKIKEIKNSNVMLGIGPQNPNNTNHFYIECWCFYCYKSNIIIEGEELDYNGHSGSLKKGDIVEVIVDRISDKLSFSVNDSNYGISCSKIPKDATLYPFVIMISHSQTVGLI